MSTATESATPARSSGRGGAIQCVVVTPEATLLDEPVVSVTLPLFDGSYGILPGHDPVVGRLGTGELKARSASGAAARLFVDGGFVQVRDNVVTVLTNDAQPAQAVNEAEAAKALEQLQQQPALTPDQQDEKEIAVARARALLRFARNRL